MLADSYWNSLQRSFLMADRLIYNWLLFNLQLLRLLQRCQLRFDWTFLLPEYYMHLYPIAEFYFFLQNQAFSLICLLWWACCYSRRLISGWSSCWPKWIIRMLWEVPFVGLIVAGWSFGWDFRAWSGVNFLCHPWFLNWCFVEALESFVEAC